MEWHQKQLNHPKNSRHSRQLARSQQVYFGIQIDFLSHGETISAQYYSTLLHNDAHKVTGRDDP
jgi:hypothetical protein